MSLTLKSEYKNFGGKLSFYSHLSVSCNSEMRFSIYQPPQAESQSLPILYFLSGLTCTEENFMVKAGAQKYAAEYGLILVVPDTSPRNTGISTEDDDYDLGTGAGFYIDATEKPWSSHYKMYSYTVKELPELIADNFPVQSDRQGIFGHSMGGHGALICAMKNPGRYKSVSAFAPIAAPIQCDWGKKCFSNYLGENREVWQEYDASELVKKLGFNGEILIDQGSNDKFLQQQQLLTNIFENACQEVNQPLNLRYQEGYDHSYYFISTFIEDHIRHHAKVLNQ